MNKYIDVDKLISKIEKSKNELISLMSKLYYAANYNEWEAELGGYNKILSFIASLQQEQSEVDLEKEYNEQWGGYTHDGLSATIDRVEFEQIARHFFELGLNAKK